MMGRNIEKSTQALFLDLHNADLSHSKSGMIVPQKARNEATRVSSILAGQYSAKAMFFRGACEWCNILLCHSICAMLLIIF